MKKSISIILSVLLLLGTTGCINEKVTTIDPPSSETVDNHVEDVANLDNHDSMYLYSGEEYEKIKEYDTLKDEIEVTIPDGWSFSFYSNSDYCTQIYSYSLNQYNSVLIEKTAEHLNEEKITEYGEFIKAQYKSNEEDPLTPKLNSFEITKDKDNNTIFTINTYNYYPAEQTEIQPEDGVVPTTIIETEITTIMKFISSDKGTFILTYMGIEDGQYYTDSGAEVLINSFKLK